VTTIYHEPVATVHHRRGSGSHIIVAEQEPYFGLISCLLLILCFPFGLILLCFPLDTRPSRAFIIED